MGQNRGRPVTTNPKRTEFHYKTTWSTCQALGLGVLTRIQYDCLCVAAFLGGVVSARAPPISELLTGLHMVVDPVQSIQIKTKCVLLSSSDLLSMNASESGRRRKLPVRMFILLNIYIYYVLHILSQRRRIPDQRSRFS